MWSLLRAVGFAPVVVSALVAGVASALIATVGGAGPAIAHPYGIETMLSLETYGDAVTVPGGRFALIERERRYDDGGAYDYAYFSRWSLSRIELVDFAHPGPPRALFPQRRDAGYLIANPSPDGRRVAIFRLLDHRLTLGVVTLSDRHVRWFDLSPDLPPGHPMPVWIDRDHLLVSTLRTPQLPWMLLFGNAYQRGVADRWHAQRRGLHPTATVVGDSEAASRTRPLDRLVRLDVRTGAVFPLLDRAVIYDVAVSPDHRRLAVLTIGAAVPPPVDRPISVDYVDRRHRLWVGMLAGRRPTFRQLPGDVLPDLVSWSSDAIHLLVYRRPDQAAWSHGALLGIDAARGVAQPLDVHPQRLFVPSATGMPDIRAAWLGPDVIARVTDRRGLSAWRLLGDRAHRIGADEDGTLLLSADATAAYRLSGRHLWVIDRSRRWRRLDDDVASLGVVRDAFRQGSRAALVASVGGPPGDRGPNGTPARDGAPAVMTGTGTGLRLQLAADRPIRIPLPTAARSTVMAVSSRRHEALLLAVSQNGVGTLSLVQEGHPPRSIETINRGLAGLDRPRAVRLAVRASDHRTYAAWLLLPPSARRGLRPPLIVMPYPGETYDAQRPDAFAPDTFAPTNSAPLLAGRGYAVLLPSLPYLAATQADPHSIAADIGANVDAAVASGLVDPGRIALYGHSYGGYGALVAGVSSARYCGIVAANAPSNLIASYGVPAPGDRLTLDRSSPYAGEIGMTEAGQDGMMAPPWRDPARYLRHSPFFGVARLTTPLLLVSSDLDYVPMDQSESLYASLVRLGRPVTLIRYWGEGHVLASPANIADQYRRILDWLSRRFAASSCRSSVAGRPRSSRE